MSTTAAGRGPVAIATTMAGNFTALARVMVKSLRAWHPQLPIFAVLADEPAPGFSWASEDCETIPISALGIAQLRRRCFASNRRQLAILIKPYLLLHLLDRGYKAAVFLDPDLFVFGPIDPFLTMAAQHSVSLTPHLLDLPEGGDRRRRELTILRSGTYNGGCIGVSDRPGARAFLAWWADRLSSHCIHDPDRGLHYDQRWLDLAPAFVEDLGIARSRGLNVAYWNQRERQLRREGGQWKVRGDVGRFFHFSGFDPLAPAGATRYRPGLAISAMEGAVPLFDEYVERVVQEGHVAAQAWPFAFDRFDNGVVIPEIAREIYRHGWNDFDRFQDPFATEGDSFYHWLCGATPNPRGLSRIWNAVYDKRPDLQRAFPDPAGADRDAFLHWTVNSGLGEHAIDRAFAPESRPL